MNWKQKFSALVVLGAMWLTQNAYAETVNGSVTLLQDANLRSAPSWTAPATRTLWKGSVWNVVNKEGDWYDTGGGSWLPATSEYVAFGAAVASNDPVVPVSGSVTLLQDVNLRDAASWSGATVRSLWKGSVWNVVNKKGDWYDTGGGHWLPATSEYVTFGATVNVQAATVPVNGSVTLLQDVNLRKSPNWNGTVERTLPKGSVWNVVNQNGDWYDTGGGNWLPAGSAYVKFGAAVVPSDPVVPVSGSVTLLQDVNLRDEASWSSATVRSLWKGSVWNVVNKKGDWYDTGGGNWLPAGSAYVQFGPPVVPMTPMPTPTPTTQTGKVTADALNVRSSASLSASILGQVYQNDSVTITGDSNGFYHIQKGTLNGWSSKSYIQVATSPSTPTPTPTTGTLSGKKIVVDPGHGGDDPGAFALDNTEEQWVNLQFALKLRDALQAKGAQVIMIRTADTSCDNMPKTSAELQCRVDKVKLNGADLYISLHANSYYVTSARGFEVFYDTSTNANPTGSKKLADTIHSRILSTLNTTDRGAKDYDYYVLRKNTVPAVLIETGFLTNSTDLAMIKNPTVETNTGNAIAAAVEDYYR